jgi:kumamolisin
MDERWQEGTRAMREWWNHLMDRGKRPGVRRVGAIATAVALVALTLSGVSALAGSQPAGSTAQHLRGNHALALGGAIPRALAHSTRGAREDGARQLTIAVTLGIQHPGTLEQLIRDQQNPKSANYHKYLTPQAFTDQFGGTPDAVAAVRKFLQDAGFHVTGVSANRLQINATGTVAQVERAFSTTISQYQLDKRTVYAPDSAPVLPDTLAANVIAISGLDNVAVFKPLQQRAAHAPAHPARGPAGGYDPTELRGAYDVAALISGGGNGSGQRVAVFELAPYIPGDVSTYRSQFSLPGSAINAHAIDFAAVTCAAAGTSCDNGAGISEADLDLEVVSALAPNATQDVYTGPNTRQGVLDTYQAIATDNVAKVVTTSWGLCEPNAGDSFMRALDGIFAQVAAQGQTIYAASGDTGSDDCRTGGSSTPAVDSPASDSYVVGAGGTSLTLAAGPSYGSEVAWNNIGLGFQFASGGGVSTFFSRPSWQQGANMPSALPQLRLVPDVSAHADPATGYAMYCTSVPNSECAGLGWQFFGGTSAAAPLWAAITADMNTYLLANSKPAVGWINTALYQLLGNAQTNTPFHDVTSGNNVVNSTPGYSAGACFDEVTGAGSPDAWNIARDFAGGVATSGGGSCPTPAPTASTNLIQNGGFESGVAPWQEFSQGGLEEVISGFPTLTHTGSAAFFPCVYPSCDDRVSQTVTVPASVSSATLVYWVDAFSWLQFSTPSLACLDHFYVTLATPDGTIFDTVQSSCATNSFGYTVQAVNVTAALQAHLNQPIVVMFRGTTAGLAGDQPFSSGWEVDDVSLIVS